MRGPDDVSLAEIAVGLGLDELVIARLGVLWGKSARRAGGRVNLLLGHLVDTAAVAERMWDGFLAPSLRAALDGVAGGAGRRLFAWLCGIHDCGKAIPAFQACDLAASQPVRASGLGWRDSLVASRSWRHDVAGARVLGDRLSGVWRDESIAWVWPLVAGHHGRFPGRRVIFGSRAESRVREQHGYGDSWRNVQNGVVDLFTAVMGFHGVEDVEPVAALSRADQLALSGFIVMADWIASNEKYFPGIDSFDGIILAGSRLRAERAWRGLRLRGGWRDLPLPVANVVETRFGDDARPFQQLMESVAWGMSAPGIMLVEAPMGEGKTKGTLAAAEIVAARFGADGVFVGMPTQATCDPMFSGVRRWASDLEDGLDSQVALLHGKRRFNPEWRELWAGHGGLDEDFVDIDVDSPGACESAGDTGRSSPAEWFLGRYRGLLSGLVVGTIDQLLFAATRTKHVMLRFAGLAGKVVIIDEVHAADIYMEQFLGEAVRWLGQARVPVILLSATVAPRQRHDLVNAYLDGARGGHVDEPVELPAPNGYPSVTAAWGIDGEANVLVRAAPAWRALTSGQLPVQVTVLENQPHNVKAVVDVVRRSVVDGGVVLVIHNTVERAQEAYRGLRKHYPGQVVLLHGRLSAAARADRTRACLEQLGPAGPRPDRLIVVATQVAEQSFDIDADLLVTDIAPIDLLLQRIGRLHRHPRPDRRGTAGVIVAGVGFAEHGPTLQPDSAGIYGAHRLIRTAALVQRALCAGWRIPEQVPTLVAAVYGDETLVPGAWHDMAEAAAVDWAAIQDRRREAAKRFVLTDHRTRVGATLDGLHDGTHQDGGDEVLEALVRDGEPSVEVIVIRRSQDRFRTLNGTELGVEGAASADMVDDVLASATRLPTKLTAAAGSALAPLAGWRTNPWLQHSLAVVLEDHRPLVLGSYAVTYDNELGLVVQSGAGPSVDLLSTNTHHHESSPLPDAGMPVSADSVTSGKTHHHFE